MSLYRRDALDLSKTDNFQGNPLQDHMPTIKSEQCPMSFSWTQKR